LTITFKIFLIGDAIFHAMLFQVSVIANAGRNEVLEDGNRLKVRLMAPATRGKANKALIKLLADHFDVKKRSIRIIKGERSREKLVEILMD
jgi:uncharacterized protein (TIGR00251 family)